MATITNVLASSAENQLRLMDPRRDLEAVADLVEFCFNETLDQDGREYLRRMRAAAQDSLWSSWISTASEWSGLPMSGYVWIHSGRLIGNASLIPYNQARKRIFLIANVAVLPDFRRQGIGKKLTEKAIDHARQKGSDSIWLQVREENTVAVNLYASLGFIERSRRSTWISKLEDVEPFLPPGFRFAKPNSRFWGIERAWLRGSYPPELSWHIQFRENLLRPDFFSRLYRFFLSLDIHQWSLMRGMQLLGVIAWQSSWSYSNHLWLAVPSESEPAVIQALLIHARRNAPSQRPLSLEYPAHIHEEAFSKAGFQLQQTLIWMELPL